MTPPLFPSSKLHEAFTALRRDLIHEDGPQISTMRNYRFAIVQYEPKTEFALRQEVQTLTHDLQAIGWIVLSLDLHTLLLHRIRAQGDHWLQRVTETERQLAARDPARGLKYLKDKIAPLIEGPGGIAADCSRLICDHADRNPETIARTVVLIGRAGALYPFYRSSALLRHLDGHTRNVPVILLYPGERCSPTGLSFMGKLAADNDYRPRIYP
ncbi:MAG: DUF1788 domain-containing protein [Myxococcales bacterium]|nr:DUF1788 domain-containing protein [Myxococcales bacterium]